MRLFEMERGNRTKKANSEKAVAQSLPIEFLMLQCIWVNTMSALTVPEPIVLSFPWKLFFGRGGH
jgi:hypothetical protein